MFQKKGKLLKHLKPTCLNYLTKEKQFEDEVIQNKSLNKDLWMFTKTLYKQNNIWLLFEDYLHSMNK